MKTLFNLLILSSLTTVALAQPKKMPSSAVATPMAAAVQVSTATESEADKAGKAELVERVFTEQSYLNSQIVDKCFSFRMSPTCWAKFSDPKDDGNSAGFGAMRYWCRFVVDYAKQEGMGDLETLNNSDRAIEKDNRPQMDEIIKTLRSKFSLTLEAPTNCTLKGYDLLMRYPYEVLERTAAGPPWSPKGGTAFFTVILSPSVTGIAVKVSPDGKYYTITGPALIEIVDSASKISMGMERGNKNR